LELGLISFRTNSRIALTGDVYEARIGVGGAGGWGLSDRWQRREAVGVHGRFFQGGV